MATSILGIASALLLGTASVNARPPSSHVSSFELATRKFEPRSTFTCPIFHHYEDGYKECNSEDLIWDNEEIYGKYVTFYIPPNEHLINGTAKDHIIHIIKEATREGLKIYEDWAPGIQINMGLVGDIPSGSYGVTHAESNAADDEFEYCNILINFPTDRDPDKRITKATTHEFYHCVQFATNYAGLSTNNQTQATWWIEGSARFFDGVTYPITGGRESILSLGSFPEEYDPEIPIVSQKYSTALFFHFLYYHQVSLETINHFIGTKKPRSSAEEDLIDLENTNLFAHNWHGFARTFVDDGFRYTEDIPLTVERITPWTEYEVESMERGEKDEERRYEVESFTFSKKFFTFPADTTYELTMPSGVQCSARKWMKGGAWHPATGRTFTVSSANDEDIVVEIVGSCNTATKCSGDFVVERIL